MLPWRLFMTLNTSPINTRHVITWSMLLLHNHQLWLKNRSFENFVLIAVKKQFLMEKCQVYKQKGSFETWCIIYIYIFFLLVYNILPIKLLIVSMKVVEFTVAIMYLNKCDILRTLIILKSKKSMSPMLICLKIILKRHYLLHLYRYQGDLYTRQYLPQKTIR